MVCEKLRAGPGGRLEQEGVGEAVDEAWRKLCQVVGSAAWDCLSSA